jgi:hypothetical protein
VNAPAAPRFPAHSLTAAAAGQLLALAVPALRAAKASPRRTIVARRLDLHAQLVQQLGPSMAYPEVRNLWEDVIAALELAELTPDAYAAILAELEAIAAGGRRNASWFSGPAEVEAEMRDVKIVVESLDRDIMNAPQISNAEKANWRAFAAAFQRWYLDNDTWIGHAQGGTYDKAREYRQIAADWRDRLVRAGGSPSSPRDPFAPEEEARRKRRWVSWAIGGAVVVAGVGAIAYAVRQD